MQTCYPAQAARRCSLKPRCHQAARAAADTSGPTAGRRAAALRLLALPVLLASPLARASSLVDDECVALASLLCG
jgi:hypothetical protein